MKPSDESVTPAAVPKCSCWIGRHGYGGNSDARRACAVHGDQVAAVPAANRCTPNTGHVMRYGDVRCECGELQTFTPTTPAAVPAKPPRPNSTIVNRIMAMTDWNLRLAPDGELQELTAWLRWHLEHSTDSTTEAAAAPPPLDELETLARAIVRKVYATTPSVRVLAQSYLNLIAEVERLRSLHAAPLDARLRELAREAAKHNHDRHFNVRHDRHGHVFQSNNDETADGVLGFSTCPHPDCLLVRSESEPVVVAEGALQEASAALDEIAAPDPDKSLAQRIRDEFADFQMVIGHCSQVYDHFSRGRISKPNTLPREVISLADQFASEDIDEAIQEAREEWDAELRALEAEWRENADAANAIVEQYSHGGDWARNGFAFLKERRIWTTCADALVALLPARPASVKET